MIQLLVFNQQTNKAQASQSSNDQAKELQSNDHEPAEKAKQEESQFSNEQLTKRETSQLLPNSVTKDGNQVHHK